MVFNLHDVIVSVMNNNSVSYVSMHSAVGGATENSETLDLYESYLPSGGGMWEYGLD
jgi:hypothetical protein